MKTIQEVRQELETRKTRSAWDRGVNAYALELLDQLEENRRYYGKDEHLHPLELKRTRNGERRPKRKPLLFMR